MNKIQKLIESVNIINTGIFKRGPEKIVTLPSHPEISDEILLKIPINLSFPKEILEDTRTIKKYIFISIDPLHEIVVEICRKDSGKSEINTVHLINSQELKRLENKFPVVYSSGETPISRICAPLD